MLTARRARCERAATNEAVWLIKLHNPAKANIKRCEPLA
jgi:hypothetical protein